MGDIIAVIAFLGGVIGFGIRFYYLVNKLEGEVKELKIHSENCIKVNSKVELMQHELTGLRDFETRTNNKFERISEEIKGISHMLIRLDTKLSMYFEKGKQDNE
jgi:hypothetical protein